MRKTIFSNIMITWKFPQNYSLETQKPWFWGYRPAPPYTTRTNGVKSIGFFWPVKLSKLIWKWVFEQSLKTWVKVLKLQSEDTYTVSHKFLKNHLKRVLGTTKISACFIFSCLNLTIMLFWISRLSCRIHY